MVFIYAKCGLYDAASREFDEIIAIDVDNSAVNNKRGNIYFTLKDYERAIEDYSYTEKLSANDAVHKKRNNMLKMVISRKQLLH